MAALQHKTPEQFALMREAGLIVARALELLREHAIPGVSTGKLDALAEEFIRDSGGVPSFKGYQGFPGSICTAVNDEVVHTIPGPTVLREGDLVSIDCGAIYHGWHGDAAITVEIGEVSEAAHRLNEVTAEAMWRGIAAFRAGARLNDIGRAVQRYARGQGRYGIVREYGGHGIGTEMHMDPMVFNYRTSIAGPVLRSGTALAIEPMLTLGTPRVVEMPDGWTVRTADGSLAAHHEHTVALTEQGPWVLTALDGGHAKLRELGVSPLPSL
jgi:methionyl aminopeptidase